MNLVELRDAVSRRAGVAYDPTALNEVLNEALQAVSTEERWPWLQNSWTFPTVAGTAAYALGATREGVRSVTIDGNEVPRRSFAEIDIDPYSYGWAEYGGDLILAPTPSTVTTVAVRVDGVEPLLVADADSPLMPVKFQSQTLVNYAAALLLERIGDTARADRRMKDYQAALKRMRHTARRARGPIAARVRPGAAI